MPTNYSQLVSPLEVLNNYFFSLYPLVVKGILTFFVALVVFFLGWIIAWIIREVFSLILSKIKIKNWLQKVGLGHYVENFSWEENFSRILSDIAFWLVLIIFLMTSLDILGLRIINSFIQSFVSYLPQVISGGLVLLLGFIFGELVRKFLFGIMRGLDKKSAKGVSLFVKWVIIVFAVLAAFSQWGVARDIVNTLAFGIVIFIALGGGLAFGLGGQDIAKEFLQSFKNNLKQQD